MLEKILVQKNPLTGEFINSSVYNAWFGFNELGIQSEFFLFSDLLDGKIFFDKKFLVIGGIQSVLFALSKLEIPPPEAIDYPSELEPFLLRKIYKSTISQIYAKCKNDIIDPPLFIKPLNQHKKFNGHVISRYRDLIYTSKWAIHEPTTPIWVSDVVNFMSEWRYFILKNEIIGCSNYKGDPLIFPCIKTIKNAIEHYKNSPSAYVIDFGVIENGSTALIEVNDGFAFGSYGLNCFKQIKILEARWKELTNFGKYV